MELTLTPRLQAVADLVPQGARLADVGTDHGYLPVRLLLDGKIQSAIASDLRAGPLSRASETARRYGIRDGLSLRLCPGLDGVTPGEVDCVSIAGMGGETIASILEAAPWTRSGTLLLLQPMTAFPDLRLFLQRSGYEIFRERIAREGRRLYAVLCVRGGRMEPMSPAELWAGRQQEDELRGPYLEFLEEKLRRVLAGLRRANETDEEEISRLEEILDGLEAMRKELL